jgi:hypothetical protein
LPSTPSPSRPHIFIDELRLCLPTKERPWKATCLLLSDNLDDLKAFPHRLGLRRDWLRWSEHGTPHFDLNGTQRTKAFLLGALPIQQVDAEAIIAYWQKYANACLQRLHDFPRLCIRPH